MKRFYLLFYILLATAGILFSGIHPVSAYELCCCRTETDGTIKSCTLPNDFEVGGESDDLKCKHRFNDDWGFQPRAVCTDERLRVYAGSSGDASDGAGSGSGVTIKPPPTCPAEPGKLLVAVPLPWATEEINSGCYYAKSLPGYLAGIYQLVVMIVILLSVVMMMYGGYKWILSAGNASAVGGAKATIGGSLAGLMLALTSFIILSTISPQLVTFRPLQISKIGRIDWNSIFCEQIADSPSESKNAECGKKFTFTRADNQQKVDCYGRRCTDPKETCFTGGVEGSFDCMNPATACELVDDDDKNISRTDEFTGVAGLRCGLYSVPDVGKCAWYDSKWTRPGDDGCVWHSALKCPTGYVRNPCASCGLTPNVDACGTLRDMSGATGDCSDMVALSTGAGNILIPPPFNLTFSAISVLAGGPAKRMGDLGSVQLSSSSLIPKGIFTDIKCVDAGPVYYLPFGTRNEAEAAKYSQGICCTTNLPGHQGAAATTPPSGQIHFRFVCESPDQGDWFSGCGQYEPF